MGPRSGAAHKATPKQYGDWPKNWSSGSGRVREESDAANEELRAANGAAVDQRGVSFDLGGIGDKQGGAERRTPLVPVRVAMATITTQQSL